MQYMYQQHLFDFQQNKAHEILHPGTLCRRRCAKTYRRLGVKINFRFHLGFDQGPYPLITCGLHDLLLTDLGAMQVFPSSGDRSRSACQTDSSVLNETSTRQRDCVSAVVSEILDDFHELPYDALRLSSGGSLGFIYSR